MFSHLTLPFSLLTANVLVSVGLRKYEARMELDPAARAAAVVLAHSLLLFLLFYVSPPAAFSLGLGFDHKNFNLWRFIFTRWIEVRARCFCAHHRRPYSPLQVLVLHHHQQPNDKSRSAVTRPLFRSLLLYSCALLVACPQLFAAAAAAALPSHWAVIEARALLLDLNANTIVLPMCLMLHWLSQARKKWKAYSLVVVFCLGAVVAIEFYSHVPSDRRFSTTLQHVLRGLQKNFLSVILLLLWMQMSVYLVLISHRGIGRQFYYIRKTLSNVVVLTYFLFIFIM